MGLDMKGDEMAVTLSSAENALKNYYLDVVADQLNNKVSPLMTAINRTSNDIWGKEVIKPVISSINGGFMAGTEDGTLPVSSGVKYDKFVLPLKNFYGTIEISDKAMRASENNTGAFVNLLNAEMESLIKSASMNFGRMLFGDGSGKLAKVKQVNKDGTIKVDTVKNLVEGMIVDFVGYSGEYVLAEHKRIISIDRVNNTIDIEKTSGVGMNNEVYKNSIITVQGSLDNELTGLEAIFSKHGKLYGLDKATHKWLNPYIKEKQGQITEEALQAAIDHIEENGGSINYIVCSIGVRSVLKKLLGCDPRGGALSYNGIPIVADRFCPDGTLYLLNTDDFTLHQLCDWVWLESGDGHILHQVPGKPVYTATLVKYADLLCSRPCGQGKICGIIEE